MDHRYIHLLHIALQHGPYAHVIGAFAYGTLSGVELLANQRPQRIKDAWERIVDKKWIIGIDRCRSDPEALDRLGNVRVPDGKLIVKTKWCTPKRSFHPKVVVLSSRDTIAVIAGSGNLSWTGLTFGCECGSVLVVRKPFASGIERQQWNEAQELLRALNKLWKRSIPFEVIADAYRDKRASNENLRTPATTEEDAVQAGEGPLSPQQIAQLKASEHFWIEGGIMGANLAKRNEPGNQLDMSPMMRTFFGFPARRANKNQRLGRVDLVYNGKLFPDRALRFSDNGMDKLNVPSPGQDGPRSYRNAVLLFKRLASQKFEMTVGHHRELIEWRQQSGNVGGAHKMTRSGKRKRPREWGVF